MRFRALASFDMRCAAPTEPRESAIVHFFERLRGGGGGGCQNFTCYLCRKWPMPAELVVESWTASHLDCADRLSLLVESLTCLAKAQIRPRVSVSIAPAARTSAALVCKALARISGVQFSIQSTKHSQLEHLEFLAALSEKASTPPDRVLFIDDDDLLVADAFRTELAGADSKPLQGLHGLASGRTRVEFSGYCCALATARSAILAARTSVTNGTAWPAMADLVIMETLDDAGAQRPTIATIERREWANPRTWKQDLSVQMELAAQTTLHGALTSSASTSLACLRKS